MRLITWIVAMALASPAAAQDFWKHWGDGRAELDGYSLTQPRYGKPRHGTAVYVYVTETFSDSLRVKADPGKHPKSDTYPVMKLNAVRDFQTGVYDYNIMTSTFLRVSRGWPLAKVSFSSQEWCGNVYHQILPRHGRLLGTLHSYFDGEADASEDLEIPEGGVYEDALPIVLRGWNGEYMKPGEERTVPLLPSLLHVRLHHLPLAWTTAHIERREGTRTITVPAGRFEVSTWIVHVRDGRRLTFAIEAEPPYRLVRQTGASGEVLALRGSTRLDYWKHNDPAGVKYLKDIGLR
jgi:hypothetical protein